MARAYLIRNKPAYPALYTVEKSVGNGCANAVDDVYLVQYLLRVIMESGPLGPGYCPPGEAPISIDGNCGKQTIRYIRYFQEEGNRRNPEAQRVVDGKLDPIVRGNMRGVHSGLPLSMVFLNNVAHDRRSKIWLDLTRDPLFPAAAASSIYL